MTGFHEAYILPAIMDVALAGLKPERQELIAQASGKVLEVGVGNGANLPYYTPAVQKVVALEPCTRVIERAEKRLHKSARRNQLKVDKTCYEFVPASAEHLPFADNSFDTAVACLVLCTIPDVQSAAQEIFRVLKPGGSLLFFEHVRFPGGRLQRVQDWINPAWKVFACGCHLNRDTEMLLGDTGFTFKSIERYRNPQMSPPFAAYMIKGEAAKPN
jgi:ubiquinone/menaquinone biosynthesis C-methylase UbiE